MKLYYAITAAHRRPLIRTFVSKADRDAWVAQSPRTRRSLTVTERVRYRRWCARGEGKYETNFWRATKSGCQRYNQ